MTSKSSHRFCPTLIAAALLAFLASASVAPTCADQALPSRSVIETRSSPSFRTPLSEVRGLWIARFNLTSPAKLQNAIDTAKRYGFNAIFVQVRGHADAYYNSTLEPRAEDLAGQPADFDPLAMAIKLAHADGMQVHAWLNMEYVWSGSTLPRSSEHMMNAHPDWIAKLPPRYPESDPSNHDRFASPSNPAMRQHVHDVAMEIVKNYDIDGIHFDYIRYQNKLFDYSVGAINIFCLSMASSGIKAPGSDASMSDKLSYIKSHSSQWDDWRRQQVTTTVESISADAHALKPWLIVSAAVFADWTDAYNERLQDWKRWLRDGALDVVVPMAYTVDTQKFTQQIDDAEQTAAAAGRYCYAGVGSFHIPAQSTIDKIAAAQSAGAQGVMLFSYGGITKDGSTMDYLDAIAAKSFVQPVTLPTLAWVAKRPPTTAAMPSDSTDPTIADTSPQAP